MTEYEALREEIAQDIEDCARARAKVVRDGSIEQVLMTLSHQMGLAGSRGEIYKVRKLAQLAERVAHVEATDTIREQREYRERIKRASRDYSPTPVVALDLP